jgi:hypothetical protein
LNNKLLVGTPNCLRFRIATVVFLGLLLCVIGCSKQVSENTQPQQPAASSGSQSIVGQSLDSGKSSQCRSQLSQIRQGIETYKTTAGTDENPPTLADINLGVSADFYKCPVSGQPYTYDPASGLVKCTTPRHGNY